MKKDSQGMKIAIVVGVLVVLAIVIFFLIKGCGVKEYTVTFDSNGGTTVSPIKVKKDDTISEPTAPTKEGYTFAGWYLDDVKFSFSTKITRDITLKARWSSDSEPEEVEDLELDVSTLSLTVGSSRKVNVTLSEGLKDAKLVWKSSDESIATVDSDGNIKALKEGEVTITVSTEDGKYSKSITVTVRPASDVSVIKVTISGAKEVEVGKTIKLTATVTPKNATNKKVTWKSSNRNVATVDSNGNVTGKKAGTVTITVTTEDGGKTASYTVTVKEAEQQADQPVVKEVKVTKIEVTTDKKSIVVGETAKVTAKVTPDEASNKAYTWSSSDNNIATVDANGVATAKKAGTVTITATASDGSKVTGSVTITVTNKIVKVTGINVTAPNGTSMKTGTKQTLKANITPTDVTDKSVTWSSSNPTAVKVNLTTGEIEAVGEGEAVITATANDGSGVKGTIKITVKDEYVVTLKPYTQAGTGAVKQYIVTSVKKGTKTTITDYQGIYFSGTPIANGDYVDVSYVVVNDVKITKAQIMLKDGTKVDAIVKYE